EWECRRCDEQVSRSYDRVRKQKYDCQECHDREVLEKKSVQAHRKQGATLVGPFPESTHDTVGWNCRESHYCETSLDNILHGRFCRTCGREKTAQAQRLTEAENVELGNQRGYPHRGQIPKRRSDPTQWECTECNKQFSASVDDMNLSRNCPRCRGRLRSERLRTKDRKYHEVAALYDWLWLGPPVANQHQKTWWFCKKRGYGRFWAPYSAVQYGNGC